MNLEEYKNQVELLKQALLFYADEENYKGYYNGKEVESSLVGVDNGSQAKFALEQLKKVEAANQEINDDYIKYLSEETDKTQTPEGIINLIKEIKKADDGNV